jgi:hypothetical protein
VSYASSVTNIHNVQLGQQKPGLLLWRQKGGVEGLTATLFDLRKTLASINYYVVPSQRLSLKNQKVDISLSKS